MASLSASFKIGNASASSLIKTGATVQRELATFQDDQARITYENSAKTSADLQTYQNYLQGRINSLQAAGTVTDMTKALTMQQDIISATHANISADIVRENINIMSQGMGGTAAGYQDKMTIVGQEYSRALAIGDDALAQSLMSQYYSLSQSYQNALTTAAKTLSGSTGSSSGFSSAVTAAEDTLKQNISNANAAFRAQGPQFLDQQSNSYLKQQTGKSGSANIFDAIAGQIGMVQTGVQLTDQTKYAQGTYTPGSILDVYTQAIALDPTKAATYQSKIDQYLNGATGIDIPGGTITYNALMNTVYAGNSGNAPYEVTQTADGSWTTSAAHVTGYTWGTDQNGNTKLMPNYSFFNTPLPSGTQTALEKAGINVKSDSNGDYWFQATTQGSWLAKVIGNYPTQGAVQHDGSVEFMTADGKLYKMVQGANKLYGLQQINQFGQVVNANVAGEYGFKPAQDTQTVSGSTDFMTKILGNSATPHTVNGQTVYQNGNNLYRLVKDSRGLWGLQQIDTSGKVVNANAGGQYGFNPDSLSRNTDPSNLNSPFRGQQFIQTLVNAHEAYMSGIKNSANPNYHAPGSLYGSLPQWLGVDELISQGQLLQNVNQLHNQAMAALAAPAVAKLPTISIAPPPVQQPLHVAAPAPIPQLKVAQSSNQSLGNVTANPQPQTANPQQTINGASLNQGGTGKVATLQVTSGRGIPL